MIKNFSDLPLNYATIKVTKSRLDKGLMSIPTSLIDKFNKNINKICVIDENDKEYLKSFTQNR